MALLERHNVDLLIVGNGDAEARLRAVGDRVNERVDRPAVTFCGAMHGPRSAYAAADVVGMGSSAARALAFAKPLIVCGEESWYRTFTPDTAPLLFRNSFWSDRSEPDPVEHLAQQIRALVYDADTRDELAGYGREFAEQHFGLELMAERMVDVYARALDGHRRRGWYLDLPRRSRPRDLVVEAKSGRTTLTYRVGRGGRGRRPRPRPPTPGTSSRRLPNRPAPTIPAGNVLHHGSHPVEAGGSSVLISICAPSIRPDTLGDAIASIRGQSHAD